MGSTRQKLSRFHSSLFIFHGQPAPVLHVGYIPARRFRGRRDGGMNVSMKWLSEHVGDNRYVVATFLALAVINALAIQAGLYR